MPEPTSVPRTADIEKPGAYDRDDARLAYEHQHQQPEDLDIESIASEDEDYESAPTDYEIATYPADYTLEVLHEKWKSGDIEIPPFQRQFVWKQVQASRLIESFLLGLPVPAVFLYTERHSQRHLVIDGQQRLRSIFFYFEGYFGETQRGTRAVFELKGLSKQSKYAGKTFADLSESEQRKLKNCVLRSFVVQQLDPADDTSIYHIFERLNTGGTMLANQEVRNCVYRGPFNALLHDFNTYRSWRQILGKPKQDTRQKDVELILRFFALREHSGYEKPMKDHLSRYMRRNRDVTIEEQEQFHRLFTTTCDSVLEHLGSRPFHIRAGLNAAVYDCVMVAFSRHQDRIPGDVADRYRSLIQDADFTAETRAGTTDIENIRARFQLAETTLFRD